MSSLENDVFDEEKEFERKKRKKFRHHHPEHFLLGNARKKEHLKRTCGGGRRTTTKKATKTRAGNWPRGILCANCSRDLVQIKIWSRCNCLTRRNSVDVHFRVDVRERSTRMDIDDFLRLVPPDSSGVNYLGEGQHSLYLAQEDVPEAMAKHLDSFKPYGKVSSVSQGKRNIRLSANIQRRVWMNHERVETTPHYDDYDNVLFVWTGRKTVHLKAFRGDGFHFRACEY